MVFELFCFVLLNFMFTSFFLLSLMDPASIADSTKDFDKILKRFNINPSTKVYFVITSIVTIVGYITGYVTESYIFSMFFIMFISLPLQLLTMSMHFEGALFFNSKSVRETSLRTLIKEIKPIVDFSPSTYFYNLFKNELISFKGVVEFIISDVGFGLLNKVSPKSVSSVSEVLYRLEKKYFKYQKREFITPDYSKLDLHNQTNLNLVKKSKTSSKLFTYIWALPLNLEYSFTDNGVVKFIFQNILVFYNFFKATLIAALLMILYFLYTVFFFKIQFLKQISIWFIIGMMYFWLMSGFNFFLKRYQYGKFTSQIQRFWKRTNTYFWLIEGFLILLFFYYFLNSSQEPMYMYDYSAINQEYLISLHVIGVNIILLSVIIYFMYFVMLRLNSNSWTQINLYLIVISVFIFFSFFIETYQFYYVISSFNERLWVFNEEENLWSIELDNPILRNKHQYLLVCLVAKYWHFLFIFLSWVFFLIKSFERKKITFVLYGANLQNMVILYVLNFACYLQWFKWIYRRFFDLPYTWFMSNIDNKFFFRYMFEFKLLALNFFSVNIFNVHYASIVYHSLLLWNTDSLYIWKLI